MVAENRELWRKVLSLLRENPDFTGRQGSYVRSVQLRAVASGTAILAVPDEFTRDFVESKMSLQLSDAIARVTGDPVSLAFTIDETIRETDADFAAAEDETEPGSPAAATVVEMTPTSPPEAVAAAALNPKYLFDTFVIGSSNRFAAAAANAVAEGPARAYNPLFIYGDSGLGKTHLLHAIGHYAMSLYPHLTVRYVNIEEFTNDFINAIRDDNTASFRRRYREADILLVDDIQFVSGKSQTMEEFFHTFNSLHNANKQVVLTSDVPPKQLDGLEDRLRSRFEMGLITDIQPPDLETRIAILRKKAANENLSLPDDVLSYIGSRVTSNIRELEGALIRVTAFASLNRQQVDVTLAEHVLKDVISDSESDVVSPTTILAQTATYFGLTLEEVTGSSRSRVMVNARQIAMYLCRELTDLSLPKIGQLFGGRDHTTVMHACSKIRARMAEKRSIYNQIDELTAHIRRQGRS